MLSLRKRRVPINASLLLASRSVGAFEGRDDGAHQKYRQQEISKSAVYSDTQLPDSEDIVNTDHDIVLNRKDQASPVAQSSLENSSSHSSSESNGNDEFPVHGQSPNLKLSSSDSETASPSLRKKSLSLPTVHLPEELQTALDNAMSSYPRWSLVQDGNTMSKFLMARTNRKRADRIIADTIWDGEDKKPKKGHMESTLRYGRREAMAYAASRVQASYGTVKRVLSEIASREPSFKPETVLDFGSGLGTVPWATHQLWGDSVYEYQCVDISRWMGEMARTLRLGGEPRDQENNPPLPLNSSDECIPGVYFKQYLPVSNKIQYDLVVAAHTLGDLPTPKLRRLSIASLWRKTKKFLVLIEVGNWTGFQNITESRQFLLEAPSKWLRYEDEEDKQLEGHVFAPHYMTVLNHQRTGHPVLQKGVVWFTRLTSHVCPHDHACPLGNDSKRPCHFAQRVQLALCEKDSPLRRKGYRQENFSYLVFKKGRRETPSSVGRLLQPIKKRTRHIICDLCTPDGEAKQLVFTKKKHRPVYKEGRRSEWGDILPIPHTTPSASAAACNDTDSQYGAIVDSQLAIEDIT